MTKNKIRLTKQELIKILKTVDKIIDDEKSFEIIEIISDSGLGSILSMECDIEFKGIKGKFLTTIGGIETW